MALDFLAGCLGGAAGVVVGYPLDTCKVHLQTQVPGSAKPVGTFKCMHEIWKRESFRGLYRGMSSPMAGIAAINAIVFGVYGNIQKHVKDPNSFQSHFLAGCAAGLVQSVVCSPIELVKTKMQLQENFKGAVKHKSSWQCAAHVFRTEGLRGLFRGTWITAVRDVPGFSSYFVTYEMMTQWAPNPSSFHILTAGGLAGIFSWVCCYPQDVVKSRLQADGLDGPPKYKGAIDCARKSYQAEGVKFFFRGLNATLYRAFPTNAACFVVVSWVIKLSDIFRLNIEIHNPEPISLIGSSSTPISHPGYHISHHLAESPESQRKRSHVIKSLIFFGAFSEAVCHSEMIELGNSLFDDEYNYARFGDEISPVLSDLNDDTVLLINH